MQAFLISLLVSSALFAVHHLCLLHGPTMLPGVSVAPEHRLRFSELKSGIVGITQSMLTLTVRHLERDGIIRRHYFPEVHPRVEYELTDMGASMLPALEGFTSWIRENWPSIEECRQECDKHAEIEATSARRIPPSRWT